MAIVTQDTVVEGVHRDVLLEWLSQEEVQERLLRAGFGANAVQKSGASAWTIALATSLKRRTMGCAFELADLEFGGRRIRFALTGKRTTGHMSLSLRTVKPSRNTLVTAHLETDAGPAGVFVERLGLRQILETAVQQILETIRSTAPSEANPTP